MQRALLGEVTANLAAVTAGFEGHSIRLVAYFFDQPTEEEIESFECVATEVVTDFDDNYTVQTEVHTLAAKTATVVQFWAFVRAGVRADKFSVLPSQSPAKP